MSGRATFTGTTFQAQVGAYIAGLLLTERPLARLGTGLPGTPQKIQFETPTSVDDMRVVTDVGEVYIQAKNTISLSPKQDSELASVADQFVRQFRDGIQENGVRRDLTPARDLLVLAVGTETAATVTENLRLALDRNRTAAATAVPGKLQDALDTLTALLDAAWLSAAGAAITAVEREQVLALCSVIVVGDSERQLVEEALIDIVPVGTTTALVDLLETWAANASATGVGGNGTAIRLALSGKCAFREPPSFQDDVRLLRKYSDDTLARLAHFTTIKVPEGSISLDRPVVSRVVQAAQQGTLAITGEPGAGKSALVYAVAQALSQQQPVFCFTVEPGVATLAALQQEIGLAHSLFDVLQQVPGPRPAYLLLDALDAARGGVAEATYKKLLEAVAALPDWHVVASVRSFDLRMGQGWQRLFKGQPPFPDDTDPSFPVVRHLHLHLLGAVERTDLARQSPSLDAALTAGGPKLEALAQNPFNLDLLADLLTGGISATTLAGVDTRGRLLAQYWQERITGLGRPASVALIFLLRQLLALKATVISDTCIEAPVAEAIDELERVGVLNLEPSRQLLGFRHHVLFDYAVARLALASNDAAMGHFRKEKAAGLLMAPSLAYWVEIQKGSQPAGEFWPFVAALVADDTLDPIVRVEVTRLAVEAVKPGDDLTELGRFFARGDATAFRGFRQFGGALLTKLENRQPLAAGPWAQLLAGVKTPAADQLGTMQMLVGGLLASSPDTDALDYLGATARRLLAFVADDEALTKRFAKALISYVARTYGTNPAASQTQLARIFEPVRFAQFGYFEVPALARHVLALAAHDADLVVKLYHGTFGNHGFRQEQTTSMVQSYIMAFHSTAVQDFGTAEQYLAKAYPTLLASFPEIGIRALAATLRGMRDRKKPAAETHSPISLDVNGVVYPFEEDSSVAWARELDDKARSNYAKVYQAFGDWLPTQQNPALLAALPDLMLVESGTALVWRVLFEAGARQLPALGAMLTPPASSAAALQSLSTRQSAIELLKLTYPQLPLPSREAAEQQWLQWDFAACPNPQLARTLTLGKLFNALGEAQLATPDARDFLGTARSTHHSLENDKLFSFTPTDIQRVDEDDEVAYLDEKLNSSPAADVSLYPAQSPAATEAQAAAEDTARLQIALSALEAASQQGEDIPDDAVVVAWAKQLSYLLQQPAAAQTYPTAIDQVLALTHHPSPQADAATEAAFANSLMIIYPLARTEAAKAMASLVAVPGVWPQIEARFEVLLLDDPHPAVRLQLVEALPALCLAAKETGWQLAEKFVNRERNPALLQAGAAVLQQLANSNAERLEPLILSLSAKATAANYNQEVVAQLLVFFAFKRALAASQNQLRDWVAAYATNQEQLFAVLLLMRNYFALGYEPDKPVQAAIGKRVRDFIWSLVEAIEPAVRTWPSDNHREPTAQEIAALNILHEIASQFFFAVGQEELPRNLATVEAQRQFLNGYTSLIARLSALGTPATVHNMLEVLSKFVDANPTLCFDLFSDAVLRTTGVAKYEYESLGASRVVELVSQYLADHRPIFEEETRRTRLIACLAVFVDAGWPEAWQLFYNLPDLLQ